MATVKINICKILEIQGSCTNIYNEFHNVNEYPLKYTTMAVKKNVGTKKINLREKSRRRNTTAKLNIKQYTLKQMYFMLSGNMQKLIRHFVYICMKFLEDFRKSADTGVSRMVCIQK